MPSLLRHPGAVPALFSSECEAAPRRAAAWRRAADARLILLACWAGAVLIDAPLVRAALSAAGSALPG